MRISIIILLFLSNFTLVCQLRAQTNGQLIQPTIPAPSIANNILDAPSEQIIAIYLPPSYNSSTKTYPVIYFLTGFSTSVADFIYGSFQGFRLQNAMDQLIQAGTIHEMIVVVVRAGTFIGGAFYVNSSVSGNWEDFVLNDVVSYVDNNYRTLAVAKSRGIAGHSMGGFGALHLAMHYPDIFGSVYALSPGLFDKNGLRTCQLFKSQSFINQFLTTDSIYAALQPTDAIHAFKTYMQQCYSASDDDTPFAYAYGAAFSPNPNTPVPYTNYPYYKSGNSVLVDSTLLQNYENGFGAWSKKIETYKENFLKLSAITVDYGTSDYYVWIRQGCVYFSSLLTQAQIPHKLVSFAGGHSDKLGQRIEQYMLPSFSNSLDFGPPSSVQDAATSPIKFNLESYPNPFNASTIVSYSIPSSTIVILKLYDILRREIQTIIHQFQDAGQYRVYFTAPSLSSGPYVFVLQGGNHNAVTRKIMVLR